MITQTKFEYYLTLWNMFWYGAAAYAVLVWVVTDHADQIRALSCFVEYGSASAMSCQGNR
jgi:hypothetical protein